MGDREPRIVQMDLLDTASGVTIRLRDASGIFLKLESQDQGSGEVMSGSRDEDSEITGRGRAAGHRTRGQVTTKVTLSTFLELER